MKPAHPEFEPRHLPDLIPTARIALIGIGALIIFALGSLGATGLWKMGRNRWQPTGPPPIPAEIGRAEIGEVFQVPFDAFGGGQALRDEQKRRLTTYGWLDRRQGVIHVPVDRAIDLYLAGNKP